jgi:hypothetical protein
MTVSMMISTYFEYVSQYAKTTKHIIHVIVVVTGNISINLNGDRQQGYKFEQIDDGDSFNLTVYIEVPFKEGLPAFHFSIVILF